MRLSERVQAADRATEPNGDRGAVSVMRPDDPLAEYKNLVRESLFAKLDGTGVEDIGGEDELRRLVTNELDRLLREGSAPLSPVEREQLAAEIGEDILGYGPVGRFLDDPSITEVMVNGTEPIYVEREGRILETEARFRSDDHVRHVIERIVSRIGRRIDEASPMVDARLPDGSRVNAIIPPLAVDGPAITIRKFSRDPYQISNLIEFGTLTVPIATLLKRAVEGRLNMLITGGTGTGKTTLLNVVSSFIPADQRIVTIEDAVELQLHQRHVVRLEARPSNVEGKGEVTIRDLVRNSLRMRPDRIVVGEVRGAEALDMLQAMNTGHEGSLSTLHANSPRDAISRLETMVMMAGIDIPVKAVRDYISSALSLMVHLSRLRDGSRRVTQISEIVGMEGDVVTMQDIFTFQQAGVDDAGRVIGAVQPTGIRPSFADHLASVGSPLPPEVFSAVATESERAA
jgi:pilus assembly protein CpaF